MKRNALLTAAALLAFSLVSAQAEDNDTVKNAIKKLSESANYSWTTTSQRPESTTGSTRGRGNAGPTVGKTADGFVHLTTTRGERTSESLVKGKKSAVKRDEAWAMVEEDGDNGGGGNGQRRGRGFGRSLRDFKAPAAQAEEILAAVSALKKDGDAYTGDLSEEGATKLLGFGNGRRGGGGASPTGAKASAKFWIADGVLAKYETSVAGSINFNGNARDLTRVTTVAIKDVGSTKVEAPEDIKKKLSE